MFLILTQHRISLSQKIEKNLKFPPQLKFLCQLTCYDSCNCIPILKYIYIIDWS